MRKRLITFLATGAYLGLVPKAPGTFGTLLGVGVAYLLAGLPLPVQAVLIGALFIASVAVSNEAEKVFGGKDPKEIVIDEVCGYVVASFLIHPGALNLILVFILFRFFDILKPYPIRLIERGLKGGLGVTADDVLAGIYANISAHIILYAVR
jgi:phosphatidylglycerophosphatase A